MWEYISQLKTDPFYENITTENVVGYNFLVSISINDAVLYT